MNWQEVIEVQKQDQRRAWCPDLAKVLSRAGFIDEKVYLRFGELPEGGRSYSSYADHHYGMAFPIAPVTEHGVSCFRARLTCGGHYLVEMNTPDAWYKVNLRADLLHSAQNGRLPYRLRGRVVGRGSSGEPLLGGAVQAEPVPAESIIAVQPMTESLEYYNARRLGMFPDHHPDYLALLDARTSRGLA